MHIIRRRRIERKYTLQKASELTGIPKTTLWAIEHGHGLPDAPAAARLRELLGLPGLPDSSQILGAKTFQRPRPFDWPRPNQVVWERMEKVFARQLSSFRLQPYLLQWMKECLSNDSPVECLALCCLAAAGAVPQWSNPHQLGFRDHCIIDQEGRALGERLLAGLSWKVEEQIVLLWPQVRMLTPQGYWRPDLLLGVAGHWPSAELDGKDHDLARDQYRDLCLGKACWRFSNEDVARHRFVPALKTRVQELISGLETTAA
ncbi:MAG: helix-turn-helix transcriptional regulator [Vulcanimicrobiota bacterium]